MSTTWSDLRREDPGSSLPVDHEFKLVVHVSDVTSSVLLRLPWVYRSQFDMDPAAQSVAAAVRASSSIPFFFRPTKLTRTSGDTSWLLDGGMLSNFPIAVFDRTDGAPPRWPTIGIKLSAQKSPGTGGRKVTGLVSLATCDDQHAHELVRPDAHQRSRRHRADDLRRHDRDSIDRLRDHRIATGSVVRERTRRGDGVVGETEEAGARRRRRVLASSRVQGSWCAGERSASPRRRPATS